MKLFSSLVQQLLLCSASLAIVSLTSEGGNNGYAGVQGVKLRVIAEEEVEGPFPSNYRHYNIIWFGRLARRLNLVSPGTITKELDDCLKDFPKLILNNWSKASISAIEIAMRDLTVTPLADRVDQKEILKFCVEQAFPADEVPYPDEKFYDTMKRLYRNKSLRLSRNAQELMQASSKHKGEDMRVTGDTASQTGTEHQSTPLSKHLLAVPVGFVSRFRKGINNAKNASTSTKIMAFLAILFGVFLIMFTLIGPVTGSDTVQNVGAVGMGVAGVAGLYYV